MCEQTFKFDSLNSISHICNANWQMIYEAKMATRGGQFCTSVLAPYAVLYVSFSLPCNILHFPEQFSAKIHTKSFLKRQK